MAGEVIASAEIVKGPEAGIPATGTLKAELEPSLLKAPVTVSDRSVSEITPSASVEIPEKTRTLSTSKDAVYDDIGAHERTAKGNKPQSYRYVIEIGSFAEREKAEGIRTRLNAKGYDAIVKPTMHQVLGKIFIIQLQPVNNISTAATLMAQLGGAIESEPVIIKVPSQ